MRWLLSLPEETLGYFDALYGDDPHVKATTDPGGKNIGSGGAVCHLLETFATEDAGERTVIINAGGESRRLPAYSQYGKALLPLPVMKWSRGQGIDQRLLELQREYLARIAWQAPKSLSAIVASGDIYLDLPAYLPRMPEADVVCLGLWTKPEVATRHGVFVTPKEETSRLLRMLQKPTIAQLQEEAKDHLLLVDSGVWLLSERALEYLRSEVSASTTGYYDLYSDFGAMLGEEVNRELSTAVWVIDEAEFYHFGSTAELVESTYRLQNKVLDQREWHSKGWEKHGTLFAQNARVEVDFQPDNRYIWIENSHVPQTWSLTSRHLITGVPENDWEIRLPEGICLDVVPLKGAPERVALRVYHYEDTFKSRSWLGRVVAPEGTDLYDLPLFPILESPAEVPTALQSLLEEPRVLDAGSGISPRELLSMVDWKRVEGQRRAFLQDNLRAMRDNSGSVFYQSDLQRSAEIWSGTPPQRTSEASRVHQIKDDIFIYEWSRLHAEADISAYQRAKEGLAHLLEEVNAIEPLTSPTSLHSDQIVWARSPVRIDVAGAWTDTPPYCLYEGGGVVNFALNINGQEPLQAYVKRSDNPHIVLRSIDLGASEVLSETAEIFDYAKPGSPFAIPKAALTLAGVARRGERWESVMERIGGGMEITLLSALPAGSGLGTSSILGATLLGALSDYFGLQWSLEEIGAKTLVLEQLLTTGGGWQDQFGGVYGGIKYITTERGLRQDPKVQWLPNNIFLDPELAPCHLLFYTGQTRMAKNILSNIVDKVLLNQRDTLSLLRQIRQHGAEMARHIAHADLQAYGTALQQSWELNKLLDPGTSTPEIEHILSLIQDYALGYKLPGAGGGGFLYIVAKDEVAAQRIRSVLHAHSSELPRTARFCTMTLAERGVMVTKS
ncbi:MAG: bifunctional fucokinase/fucose-1-phosphate guanylyltransferase [Porphyromonas sp.]|nr:bifunctional fucokinase/fucose-1-phosphate guanylyltransferase [Porphyromonas sp.]